MEIGDLYFSPGPDHFMAFHSKLIAQYSVLLLSLLAGFLQRVQIT